MWSLTRGRALKGGGLSPGVVVSYQWVVAHQEMVSHQGVDTHGEVVSHQEVVAQQEVLAQCLSSMSAEVACTAVSNTSHGFTPQLTKMSSPCLPVNDGGREWGREGGGVEERDMPIQRIMRFQAARQYLSLRAWPCPQRHFKDLDASALLCSNLFPRVCWRFRF